ncbi:MAG TPA: 3-hydroxyacyl-CoA dehydrogenase/enoyl-CoA hydratase family protein [Candidatus Limnocylindria bacterium]|nr:3-hydroxyacyl-CoA dehydrogenase/enoyl-CoA hydratase family protein [Candidatus Limnocylindria bacterium]
MIPRYPRVVVLGAGTMGAQLACLLAGSGSRVTLLDLDAGVAAAGLKRVAGLKPSPLYSQADLARITTAGFDTLTDALADASWILEAIVEQLGPKRDLMARVDEALASRAADAWPIVTTNTSGLSISALAEERSDAFRRHFFGTHFFNPPRYARLLEIIPLESTEPKAVTSLAEYASRQLGKGTVVARDTPAFIANRLGVHGLMTALELAKRHGLGVDQVDELTGPLIGRSKSATFRTLDLVGIDVAVAVADHCFADLTDDPQRERFAVPQAVRDLVASGALGEKSGAGFYRKIDGEILAIDLATGEYRPRQRLASAAVEMARNERDLATRLSALLSTSGDDATEFLRDLFSAGLGYAAQVGPQIADDALSVDRAMRWGFGWELGPLETLDALGPLRAQLLGETAAALPERYYVNGSSWSFEAGALRETEPIPDAVDVTARRNEELPHNSSASVVELDENILGLELHGKLNVIGLDTIAMIRRAVDLAEAKYDGLVIGTQSPDFSAGANLALLLLEAEEGEWASLDRAARTFQDATSAIRHASVPVVVAPRGRTLGGGAELVLASARAQALRETYIGLVEAGVGLIPAGGGSTAMARRAGERMPTGVDADLFPFFQAAFTTIAFARVATSAVEARELGLLTDCDAVTANAERQWADAARTARQLAEQGHAPPGDTLIRVLGRRGIAAAEALSYNQLAGRQISEHDRRIVMELARVMSGGDVAEGTLVGEQYLLDLEREAFLRLLGEKLTRDRIRHTLKTGKPLRN